MQWRSKNPTAEQTIPFLDQYVPQDLTIPPRESLQLCSYLAEEAWVVRTHVAAISNGTVFDGEEVTIEPDQSEANCLGVSK